MKQKLAVARAMLHAPALIFLDEPTSGLDPLAAAALREDIAALTSRGGATVFLTTHNLAEAERLCSLVGVIREGRLIAFGHPDELRSEAGGRQVEVVGSGFDVGIVARLRARPEVMDVQSRNGRLTIALRQTGSIAPLVSALVQSGAQIEEVHKGEASLEDVFLTLMAEEHAR